MPLRCPVAGVFQFKQRGDLPFETRIIGGITDSPRPQIKCLDTISSMRVCDAEQKEMAIDAEYCLSVDTYGRPVDIYSIGLFSPFLPLHVFFPTLLFQTINQAVTKSIFFPQGSQSDFIYSLALFSRWT